MARNTFRGRGVFSPENKQLLQNAVSAGVMCSICSKNDAAQVAARLSAEGVAELFVFPSVNWSPKGNRVEEIIREMNLRPVNVMFIDDNPSNREEVMQCCPGVTAEDVTVIPALRDFFAQRTHIDPTHDRLARYRLLEKKRNFQAQAGSNLEFLRQSNIRVQVGEDCAENLSRIHDLVSRSNQLNFTKVRSTAAELEELFRTPGVNCGYVTVADNFGDYGIVGFYAVKDGKLLHFTFSCRTLGMGVEQYLYCMLGKPELTVVGEVSSDVNTPEVDWIHCGTGGESREKADISSRKILIKGPCDLQQIFAYIAQGQDIITEFVYVNDRGIRIAQGNHTTHILQSRTLPEREKERLARELLFGDEDMYHTRMFDPDLDYIVFSLFSDPNFGLYRERKTGIIVAYGEYVNDITDKSRWDTYINGEVHLANCKFTREDLEWFAREYEYIGRLTPEAIVDNLEEIYRHINPQAVLILVLGSETKYENNSQSAYEDRHEYHQKLNAAVRAWKAGKDRVQLLDVNRHITGQSDFTNNINHFARSVYYNMSNDLVSIIEATGGGKLKKNNALWVYVTKQFHRAKKSQPKWRHSSAKSWANNKIRQVYRSPGIPDFCKTKR